MFDRNNLKSEMLFSPKELPIKNSFNVLMIDNGPTLNSIRGFVYLEALGRKLAIDSTGITYTDKGGKPTVFGIGEALGYGGAGFVTGYWAKFFIEHGTLKNVIIAKAMEHPGLVQAGLDVLDHCSEFAHRLN